MWVTLEHLWQHSPIHGTVDEAHSGSDLIDFTILKQYISIRIGASLHCAGVGCTPSSGARLSLGRRMPYFGPAIRADLYRTHHVRRDLGAGIQGATCRNMTPRSAKSNFMNAMDFSRSALHTVRCVNSSEAKSWATLGTFQVSPQGISGLARRTGSVDELRTASSTCGKPLEILYMSSPQVNA